jgi:DNA-binding IclR family transcriptional regulator
MSLWQWSLLSPEYRKPHTQAELAEALGVSRRYVRRILKRLAFDAPLDLLERSPVTPAYVIAMRQLHEQYRRQQEEQARQEAERWMEAWREEESKTQQQGWPRQNTRDERDTSSDSPELCTWREEEEEVRRIMFPWQYKDKKL